MQTIGNLIDELTIANIRIWMAEDIKRDPTASPDDIVKATMVTNITNQKRSDLIQEIDEKVNEIMITKRAQKLYKTGDTKLYGK